MKKPIPPDKKRKQHSPFPEEAFPKDVFPRDLFPFMDDEDDQGNESGENGAGEE